MINDHGQLQLRRNLQENKSIGLTPTRVDVGDLRFSRHSILFRNIDTIFVFKESQLLPMRVDWKARQPAWCSAYTLRL